MLAARGVAVLLLLAALPMGVAAAEVARPLREVQSANGRFLLEIQPGRPGRTGRPCQATLTRRSKGESDSRMWRRPLVNDVAPTMAFVRDDGRYVVTLDEYRRGGARNAVVIYGPSGELLRHFLLPDVLGRDDWSRVQVDRSSLRWLDKAEAGFDEAAGHFVIRLADGTERRIDLKRLQLVRAGKSGEDSLAGVPAEILAVLLPLPSPDAEQAGPESLPGLGELTPEQAARAARIATELTKRDPNTPPDFAAPTQPLPPSEPPDSAPAREPPPVAPKPPPPIMPPSDASTALPAEGASPDEAEPAPPLIPPDLVPPPPSLVAPADYVAWLNGLGVVDDQDAGPVYDQAFAKFVSWTGDASLLVAALRGDEAAIDSPEIAAWLKQNSAALATFRQATSCPARGWRLASADGSLIGILLPQAAQMRSLAQLSILDGKRLLQEGRAAEAGERFADALAAGGHAGDGVTLMENVVGVAIQGMASEALLDMQIDPSAAGLDAAALASQVAAAARPPRPLEEALQAERAMYLDAAQRLWEYDPRTGESRLREDQVRQLYGLVQEGQPDTARTMAAIENLERRGFEQTVTDGNAYYDELTAALSQPYSEAAAELRQIEGAMVDDEGTGPLLKILTPAVTRYHFIRTRGEATRRAAVLVAELQAYRQSSGDYPESLSDLNDPDAASDPFTGAPFVYRRTPAGFTLYSVGANGTDDGGVHDRRGETNDVVFWPRPARPRPGTP